MTKLATEMTAWDFAQFALTERVNPNGWEITDIYIGDDFVSLEVGFKNASHYLVNFIDIDLLQNKDGVVIDDAIMDFTSNWELLWRNLINYCDNQNDRIAEKNLNV